MGPGTSQAASPIIALTQPASTVGAESQQAQTNLNYKRRCAPAEQSLGPEGGIKAPAVDGFGAVVAAHGGGGLHRGVGGPVALLLLLGAPGWRDAGSGGHPSLHLVCIQGRARDLGLLVLHHRPVEDVVPLQACRMTASSAKLLRLIADILNCTILGRRMN